VLLAKTAADGDDPRLPGSLESTVAGIRAAGGRAHGVQCDIRDAAAVTAAIGRAVELGGAGCIDVVVNNASAISLTPTPDTPVRKWDLMHAVNGRGTYVVTAAALPYLTASAERGRSPQVSCALIFHQPTRSDGTHPTASPVQVLMLSPPLDMSMRWFAGHTAYTAAKYTMSMSVAHG